MLQKIKNDFLSLPTSPSILDFENFFKKNLVIIKTFRGQLVKKRKIGKNENRTERQNFITFIRKPRFWENLVFISEEKCTYYIRTNLEHIKPLLSPPDSVLRMSVPEIFKDLTNFNSETFFEQEEKLDSYIRIYYRNSNGVISTENKVYGSFFYEDKPIINLLIENRATLFTSNGEYSLICHDSVFRDWFNCSKCQMIFEVKCNRDDHEKRCYLTQKITTKQKKIGDDQSEIQTLVKYGYLPESFLNFRQKYVTCFDIETLENPNLEQISDWTVREAHHKIVSVAISSNIPNCETKFILRQSSESISEQKLVDEFLDTLYQIHDAFLASLPPEIFDGIEKIENDLKNLKFGWLKTSLQKLLRFLKKYTLLKIYGFNSGLLYSMFQ